MIDQSPVCNYRWFILKKCCCIFRGKFSKQFYMGYLLLTIVLWNREGRVDLLLLFSRLETRTLGGSRSRVLAIQLSCRIRKRRSDGWENTCAWALKWFCKCRQGVIIIISLPSREKIIKHNLKNHIVHIRLCTSWTESQSWLLCSFDYNTIL